MSNIGIQDVYGNYLINVPDVFTTTITYAGATIFYKHTKARYQDILEISGQTTETLKVAVLFQQKFYLCYKLRGNYKHIS